MLTIHDVFFLLQNPPLFSGLQFYFSGEIRYPLPNKTTLVQLVKLGGGQILSREPKPDKIADSTGHPFHLPKDSALNACSVFVVFDDSVLEASKLVTSRLSHVQASWILNSIANFEIQAIS